MSNYPLVVASVHKINTEMEGNRMGVNYRMEAWQEFSDHSSTGGFRVHFRIGLTFGHEPHCALWGNYAHTEWFQHPDSCLTWDTAVLRLQELSRTLNANGVSWLSNIHNDNEEERAEGKRRLGLI